MSDEGPQALILSLFYGQQAGRGTLMSLSPNEVIKKQLAQLFERTYWIWGYFAKPDSCRTFKGGREGLHIISLGTPWRCIVVLKVAMWSNGSRVPSYESNEGILNFGGKGWPLMEAVKGEFVWWTRSSTRFILLMFSLISSITFFIWSISLSKCGTLLGIVPLD